MFVDASFVLSAEDTGASSAIFSIVALLSIWPGPVQENVARTGNKTKDDKR